VIQGCAVATLVLNGVSLWKQETRQPGRLAQKPAHEPSFGEAWSTYIEGDGTRWRLVAIALGTMAFGMQDVLLEPYGGQVLGMSVGQTTWLTATLAIGGLIGFSLASSLLGRGGDPARLSAVGAALGVPAFVAVIAAASTQSTVLFAGGVLLIGFGAGLFGHGTLTLTMNRAPKEQVGLALGAWGAVQATAAGVGTAAGGVLRDLVLAFAPVPAPGPAGALTSATSLGYVTVYAIEIVLLVAAAVVMLARVEGRARPAVSVGRALQAE
jgi:BCD family chlorophyll transporter-like MFS transporter